MNAADSNRPAAPLPTCRRQTCALALLARRPAHRRAIPPLLLPLATLHCRRQALDRDNDCVTRTIRVVRDPTRQDRNLLRVLGLQANPQREEVGAAEADA